MKNFLEIFSSKNLEIAKKRYNFALAIGKQTTPESKDIKSLVR